MHSSSDHTATHGFKKLNLIEPILKAVQAEGYDTPTPIQQMAIPKILERKDLLACAQTGTGKTAAFALPILQLLAEANSKMEMPKDQGPYPKKIGGGVRDIRVLVLTPTRELASQIGESFTNYGKGLHINNTVIFGGVGQNPQAAAIRRGVDVVIATPGRLLDLLQQRLVSFKGLEILVLDEADRMLDMGFIHDVRRIILTIPQRRQTLFFSATMPPEISTLANQILNKPVRIAVTPVATTAELIDQSVFHVPNNLKTSLLIHLLQNQDVSRAITFTRTKRDANRVAEGLMAAGIGAAAIHGNKSQGARERALESIKSGKLRVLVATDIAARGIDIDQVTHVFNYDIPNIPESYVHRIGRTARAGKSGQAISFCAPDERQFLSDIERLIRKRPQVLATPTTLSPEKRGGGGGNSEGRVGGKSHRARKHGHGGSTNERVARGPSSGGARPSSAPSFGGRDSRGPKPRSEQRPAPRSESSNSNGDYRFDSRGPGAPAPRSSEHARSAGNSARPAAPRPTQAPAGPRPQTRATETRTSDRPTPRITRR